MTQKRITIFTGHFGSGKTELSIREAVLSAQKQSTVLADLDIINTYFRSNEERRYMEERGVKVLAPRFATSQVDIPALTPELDGAFLKKDIRLIADVGGDPDGARVLRRYGRFLAADAYDMILVVNLMRPFTRSAGEIVEMAREIEEASGLKITAMINNTHLKSETTKELVWRGQQEAEAAAEKLGLERPVITCARAQWMPDEADPANSIVLEPMLRAPWEFPDEF